MLVEVFKAKNGVRAQGFSVQEFLVSTFALFPHLTAFDKKFICLRSTCLWVTEKTILLVLMAIQQLGFEIYSPFLAFNFLVGTIIFVLI